jgi:alcohol dehydrogenase
MSLTKPFSFYAPTRIEYGVGKMNQLADEVKGLRGKRLLIITDNGIIKAGLLTKIEEHLKNAALEFTIFSDVESNPKDTTVDEVAALAKKEGVDVLVAVGGGSPMDTAKAASVLVTNGGTLDQYYRLKEVKLRPLPLITIPTTAGTGSEVTPWAVITDTRKEPHTKETIGSALTYANIALVDPILTVGLPSHLTAYTGIDALTHAIEGYFALTAEPIADGICLNAIKLISSNLAPAVLNGNNLEARDGMMLGSLLAGLGFANSDCALVHCIGEAIGGFYDTHHGLLMGIFLPYVLEYNLVSRPERFAEIAQVMGEDIRGLSTMAAAYKSVDAVVNLSKIISMPVFKDIKVKTEDFPIIAEIATQNSSYPSNPRNASVADIVRILKEAYADKFGIATK